MKRSPFIFNEKKEHISKSTNCGCIKSHRRNVLKDVNVLIIVEVAQKFRNNIRAKKFTEEKNDPNKTQERVGQTFKIYNLLILC